MMPCPVTYIYLQENEHSQNVAQKCLNMSYVLIFFVALSRTDVIEFSSFFKTDNIVLEVLLYLTMTCFQLDLQN
jgi:hypothetical protein